MHDDPDAMRESSTADAGSPAREGGSGERSWPYRRLVAPVLGLLRQGLAPRRIARALAVGSTVGISPLVGTTTATCTLLIYLFRLNPVATLTANYGVYPLQLLLILPFAGLGGRITGWENLPIRPAELRELVRSQGVGSLEVLGVTIGNAAVAWILVAPVAYTAAYLGFRILLTMRIRELRRRDVNTRNEPDRLHHPTDRA